MFSLILTSSHHPRVRAIPISCRQRERQQKFAASLQATYKHKASIAKANGTLRGNHAACLGALRRGGMIAATCRRTN